MRSCGIAPPGSLGAGLVALIGLACWGCSTLETPLVSRPKPATSFEVVSPAAIERAPKASNEQRASQPRPSEPQGAKPKPAGKQPATAPPAAKAQPSARPQDQPAKKVAPAAIAPQQEVVGFNPRLPAVFRTRRGQSLVQRFGPRIQFLPGGKIRRFIHVPQGSGTQLKGIIESRWLKELFGAGNKAGNQVLVEPNADMALNRAGIAKGGNAWEPTGTWTQTPVADWLIVDADEAAQNELDKWLGVWWTGRDHIEIRAVIIERENTRAMDLGAITELSPVDGNMFLRSYRSSFPNSTAGGTFIDLQGFQDEVSLKTTLQMLQREGTTSIRSVPSIVLRDGAAAQISNTTQVPYQQTLKFDVSGALKLGIGWAVVGVKMDVTAAIPVRDRINLQFEIELSLLNPGLDNPAIPAPAISTTLLQGHANLADGQSLWIGGLESEFTSSAARSFPILGDIPLLGALFRSSFEETTKSEVVFILTPTIKHFEGALPEVETGGTSAFDSLFGGGDSEGQ